MSESNHELERPFPHHSNRTLALLWRLLYIEEWYWGKTEEIGEDAGPCACRRPYLPILAH